MAEHERRKHKCLDILGLPHTAADDDVKRAYHRLARQHHPDKNTEDGATERFQEISYAYKYLTEGPSGVQEEEDDADIPIDVLLRLFPWLFGGGGFFHRYPPDSFPVYEDEVFGNPYSNPFVSRFHQSTFYDSNEFVIDDDYDDYNDSKPASSYVPGLSKEERKKEKRRRAKERKRTAKVDKPTPPSTTTNGVGANARNSSVPAARSSYQTPSSPARHEASAGISSQKDSNHTQNIPSKSKISNVKSSDAVKASEAVNNSALREHSEKCTQGTSSSKKSKKQLQAEQIKREKEMESIKSEFLKQQKEQSEREAHRRGYKLESDVLQRRKEQIARDARHTAENENQDRQDGEDRQGRETSCMPEDVSVGTEADANSVITDIDYNDNTTYERNVDELSGDNLKEIDNSKGDNSKNELPSGGVKRKSRFSVDKKAETGGNGTNRQKSRQNSANRKSRSASRSGSKPRPSAEYSTSQEQTSKGHSRKEHRAARKKANHEAEWSGDAKYDDLMPQDEAEEMRMYHDAIYLSTQQTEEQCGNTFIPRSSEEERSMLEQALRESQDTSSWHNNIDCVDNIPNVASPSEFHNAPSARCDPHDSVSRHSKASKTSTKSKAKTKARSRSGATCQIVFGDLGNWLPDSEDNSVIEKNGFYSQTASVEDRSTGGEGGLHTTVSVSDMDDIDDCDTTCDDGSHSYGLSLKTSSTFDLNIPTAIDKEKMKSYYKRRK